MEIRVTVATILLKKAHPPLASGTFSMELAAGTDVEGLIAALGLPPEVVGSVTVNKKRSPRERVLENGDRVAIVPSISGG